MRLDLYTKTVLTVIALCLIWIAAQGHSLIPVAQAEGATRVVIVGYETSGGQTLPLPLPVSGR
jgi:hypothetical protein